MMRFFISVFLLTGCVSFAQSKRIAVYDFDDAAVRGDAENIFGNAKPVGAQVAAEIVSKLVKSKGNFDVIDRNQIDNLMKEQNLKFSPRFDPKDAPRLGKLLNVSAIVTGAVESLAGEVQNGRLGIGVVGVARSEAVVEAQVSVRVVSTESGRILVAETADKKQKHNLGNGMAVKGQGSGQGSATSHPLAQAGTAALKSVGDDLAEKIIDQASSITGRPSTTTATKSSPQVVASTRTPSHVAPAEEPAPSPAPAPAARTAPAPAPAAATTAPASQQFSVGRIDGTKVYITAGENAGIHVNDYMEVRHPSGTMKDDQGNVITMDERVETVIVTEVQDNYSIAKTSSGVATKAQVGDHVRRAKAPVATKKAAAPTTSANPTAASAPTSGGPGIPAPTRGTH
jgi:curli biogenesis system outer membrane secretion channel CsgG